MNVRVPRSSLRFPTHWALVPLLGAGVFGGACMAHSGDVTLRDGRIQRGTVEFTTNGLAVKAPGGIVETVAFADVRRASFENDASAAATNVWQSTDVGEVFQRGSFAMMNGVLNLRGSGWGCWPSEDGLHLAWQPLRGDGQIIAHTREFDDALGLVFAGVTLRESLAPDSPHVTVLTSSANRQQLRARTTNGADGFFMTDDLKANPWLRITRRGQLVTAYHSADGADWQLIEQKDVLMQPEALAGVLVATRINSALGGASFSAVAVTAGQQGNGSAELPGQGLVLRDGTVLAGPVTSEDGRMLQVVSNLLGERAAPAHRVAAALFRPAPASLGQESTQPARPGLWLLSGDVMDGELVSLGTNRITIDSVLLGQKRYDLSANPVAYVFDRVSEPAPAWMLHLRDGSRVGGESLTADGGQISVQHPLLGRITVPASAVTGLTASGGSAQAR